MSWSFKTIAFRRMDPDGAPRWFAQSIAVTVDVIAGDVSATPRRYVDLGARDHAPAAPPMLVASVGGSITLRGVAPYVDRLELKVTSVANRATITFDLNKPIVTNTHVNTLDLTAPVTALRALPPQTTGSRVVVRWNADDGNGAGARETVTFDRNAAKAAGMRVLY